VPKCEDRRGISPLDWALDGSERLPCTDWATETRINPEVTTPIWETSRPIDWKPKEPNLKSQT